MKQIVLLFNIFPQSSFGFLFYVNAFFHQTVMPAWLIILFSMKRFPPMFIIHRFHTLLCFSVKRCYLFIYFRCLLRSGLCLCSFIHNSMLCFIPPFHQAVPTSCLPRNGFSFCYKPLIDLVALLRHIPSMPVDKAGFGSGRVRDDHETQKQTGCDAVFERLYTGNTYWGVEVPKPL